MPISIGILKPADIEYARVQCELLVDDQASDINKKCLAQAEVETRYNIVPIDVLGNVANILDS